MNRLIILKRFARGALFVGILGSSFLSHAQEMIGRWTAAEVASLPEYCQVKIGPGGNKEMWRSTLGPDGWLHLHHYCYGLIYYSRSSTEIDRKERLNHAQKGISQFNYVLKFWPANFQLRPLAQMYKGQLEVVYKLN